MENQIGNRIATADERQKRIILIAVGAAVSLAFLSVIMRVIGDTRRAATGSLVLSVHDAIQDLEVIIPSDDGWQLLDGAQTRRLVAALDEPSFDAPNSRTYNGIPVDSWDQHLWIAIRRSENGVTQYMVWSIGPDGESGTVDDFIASGDPQRTINVSHDRPLPTAGLEWRDD